MLFNTDVFIYLIVVLGSMHLLIIKQFYGFGKINR